MNMRGQLAAIVLALISGSALAVSNPEADVSDSQDDAQQVRLAQCTEQGAENGLVDEELDAYINSCMQEGGAQTGAPTDEG